MSNHTPGTYYRISDKVDALFYNGDNADDIADFAEQSTFRDWLTGGIYMELSKFPTVYAPPKTWVVKGWDGGIEIYTQAHFAREFSDTPIS